MMLTLAHLPIDLITDILSRLPAKTVVCLKIVCKSWCNLISDDYFVNYRLEQSLATKSNLHYVVTVPRFYLQEYDHLPEPREQTCPVHYSADFDSLGNLRELSHPFKDCKTGTRVFGSCRGLLLLHVTDGPLLLYNPTTQTYNVLPGLPVYQDARAYGHLSYGFGYDNATRDFKCVKIMQRLFKEIGYLTCEVMVYSLRTNCWKRVPDVPCYFRSCDWGVGVLVHETLHWVGTNSDGLYEFIVAFNLRDEAFSCRPLPNFHFEPFEGLYVGMLDGCLCLLANRYPHCNVWVMKEYGVGGSWTKMFILDTLDCLIVERPVSYSLDKKRLLVKMALFKLAYHDLETKEHTDLRFADWDTCLNAHVYVENLLMLDYTEFADDIHIRKKRGKEEELEEEKEEGLKLI
ncbi:F-box protein CPR1-like isoform X2 [Silene latifolia]|uniref:F-box protein CPR1-like isoform X2 n=1 Tax=Silene latifolia TaxID=37657 RepID=UPI003D77057C